MARAVSGSSTLPSDPQAPPPVMHRALCLLLAFLLLWHGSASRYSGSTLVSETKYDYNANSAMVRERAYNASGFVKQSNLSFSFDGKLLAQSFSEPGSLMYVTSQVLYNYDADGNRIGLQRQQLGTVGMSYGVVTSENHQYLVDTSQPYAEVIQEKTWLSDGAGNAIGDAPVIDRYDIGMDRLRVFRYQVNANAPLTAIYSNWLLFDGLGSTRMRLGFPTVSPLRAVM